MIWSTYDWYPRLGGYSGYIPDYWAEAHAALATFPGEPSLEFLDGYDARYVILRVNAGEESMRFDSEEAAVLARAAAGSAGVERVERFGNDYLVTLR